MEKNPDWTDQYPIKTETSKAGSRKETSEEESCYKLQSCESACLLFELG